MVKKNKYGKIDYSLLNTKPLAHEIKTAEYFARLGLDVAFLRPSNIKGSNNADFLMNGKFDIMKSR